MIQRAMDITTGKGMMDRSKEQWSCWSPFRTASHWLAGLTALAIIFPSLSGAQQQNSAETSTDRQLMQEFLRKSSTEIVNGYFQQPPYPIFAMRRLIDIGDPAVIPRLEEAFSLESRDPAKEFLAATLVDLGDEKTAYFDYVAMQASTAAASDLPFPFQLGTRIRDGDSLPPLKRVFVLWVKKHHADVNSAMWEAAFDMPDAIEALGEAGDLRSEPIFLKGLKSPNVLIVFESALGLARLQDSKTVSSIIHAAKGKPHSEQRLISRTLLYFATPEAQRTAKQMIGDPVLLRDWRAEVKNRGWKNAMRERGP